MKLLTGKLFNKDADFIEFDDLVETHEEACDLGLCDATNRLANSFASLIGFLVVIIMLIFVVGVIASVLLHTSA